MIRGSKYFINLTGKFMKYFWSTGLSKGYIEGGSTTLSMFYEFMKENDITEITQIGNSEMEMFQVFLYNRKNKQTDQRLKAQTRAQHIHILKKFFMWLTKSGIILYNPANVLELPRLPKRLPRTIMTYEEVKTLMSLPDLTTLIGYRNRVILEVLYATGMRASELRNLKMRDIDFENGIVNIREGKGGKDRVVPLIYVAHEYLKEYVRAVRPMFIKQVTVKKLKHGTMKPKPEVRGSGAYRGACAYTTKDDYLFLGLYGNKLCAAGLGSMILKYVRNSEIQKEVTAQVFRHTTATHLLENGMSIRYIQELLGHESLKTTERYTKVTISNLKRMYRKYHPKEKRYRR